MVVALQQGKQRQPEKKPENFRRTGSGVGFQKRDWQWGSQSMIPHKSESKPRRDSHSSSNFGPEKNGKVGRMSIAQIWFLLLFWGRVVQYLQVNFNLEMQTYMYMYMYMYMYRCTGTSSYC